MKCDILEQNKARPITDPVHYDRGQQLKSVI